MACRECVDRLELLIDQRDQLVSDCVRASMSFVCFPSPAVAVMLTRLEAHPTRGADQRPRARAIRDDAVQRVTDDVATLASFDSRSDGFRHFLILSG